MFRVKVLHDGKTDEEMYCHLNSGSYELLLENHDDRRCNVYISVNDAPIGKFRVQPRSRVTINREYFPDNNAEVFQHLTVEVAYEAFSPITSGLIPLIEDPRSFKKINLVLMKLIT